MSLYIWAFVVVQLVLLLFSPLLRARPVFKWYYRNVFYPIFEDADKFRFKFHVVPILYLAIYLYCCLLFFRDIEGLIRSRLYAIERWFIIPVALMTPISCGLLTMLVKPESTYTAPPVDQFDGILFHAGVECRTCKMPKYARSKHCAICGRCTQLADHHCVWANNCIGKGNYEYFYLFLASNVFLTVYGFTRLLYLQHTVKSRTLLTLALLLGSFALILVIFSYFQVVLIKDGMTTNEESKWLVVHDMMRARKLVVDNAGKFYYRIPENEDSLSPELKSDEGPELTTTSPSRYTFYSTNPYDNCTYTVKYPREIVDYEEITNIYDKGSFCNNLKDRIRR